MEVLLECWRGSVTVCPTQLPTDLGSGINNWVRNECIQHPRVQIYTDASKRGADRPAARPSQKVGGIL